MKINNYKKFKLERLEQIFEQAISESIVYFSPRLRELLKQIKNDEVSQALLDVELTDIKNDITFIDLDDNKPEYLTFTRMSKAMKNLDSEDDYIKTILKKLEKEPNRQNSDYIFTNNTGNIPKKDRNPVRITRVANKLLGNMFKPPQIDAFSRKLMAKITKEDQQFRVVEGDDIAYWYKRENYLEIKGDLGNSCMKEAPSYYFKIYTENPDVCRLVILVDEDEKLLGRALLWKISSHSPKITDELFFMDRQYATNHTDTERFREYAKNNGWAYKTINSVGNMREVTFNNENLRLNMQIDISDTYDNYPYMDTFKRYSPSSGALYNDEDDASENVGDYILSSTSGGYNEIEGGHYSDYDDENVPEEYAVWSEEVSSYLHSDRAIEVTSGSRRYRGWYPDGYDDIVYDEWIDEYIHTNDAIYSDYYDYYILEDSSVRAITNVDYDGEPRGIADIHEDDSDFIPQSDYNKTSWFKRLSYDYSDWDDVYHSNRSLFFTNYKKELSLNEFETIVYKITELSDEASEIGFEIGDIITKQDADALKCKIDKENPLITDHFDYNHEIEDYLQGIFNALKKRYKEIEIIVSGKTPLLGFDDDSDYLTKIKRLQISIDERMDEIKDGKYNNDVDIEDND